MFFYSCEVNIDVKKNIIDATKIESEKYTNYFYTNIAIINEDSCKNWKLPITSFSVEYPDTFQPFFHNSKEGYLELNNSSDGFVKEQIHFSYAKIKNDYLALYYLRNYDKEIKEKIGNKFTTISLNFIKIGDDRYAQLTNYYYTDNLKIEKYKGNYIIINLVKISPDSSLSGIKIVFVRSENEDNSLILNKTEEKILRSIRFNY